MTSQPKTRRLPRFGLKSLFALVLIVAAYFGSWPWLEERAHRHIDATSAKQYEHELEDFRSRMVDRRSRIIDGNTYEIEDRSHLYAVLESHAPATLIPYVMSADEADFNDMGVAGFHRRYYVWLFGWTVRLPFTSAE